MSGENNIKTRDLQHPRWVQPDLDGFLQADAESREHMIDETTRQVHLARQFMRFDKAQKICRNKSMQNLLETYKRQTLKLMERG